MIEQGIRNGAPEEPDHVGLGVMKREEPSMNPYDLPTKPVINKNLKLMNNRITDLVPEDNDKMIHISALPDDLINDNGFSSPFNKYENRAYTNGHMKNGGMQRSSYHNFKQNKRHLSENYVDRRNHYMNPNGKPRQLPKLNHNNVSDL